MRVFPRYSTEVTITNKFGFHVRPIQRFAELARSFVADVEVHIEDRQAPGKSVIKLMSLKGQCGARMKIVTEGEDAKQALCTLSFLAKHNFLVEDELRKRKDFMSLPRRIANFACCFDSKIMVACSAEKANAKDLEELEGLGIGPDSELSFHAEGPDGEQARAVLETMARQGFYVEPDELRKEC